MTGTYRTALVTGASGGLGEALARRLAQDGIEVALGARRAERLEDLARSIRAHGGRARAYPMDLSRPEHAQEIVRGADDEMGGLDLVVANAAVSGRGALEHSWEDCQYVVGVNVLGAMATLTSVLPRMVARGRGHLVGISSVARRTSEHDVAFAASKAFLSRYLEQLRVELLTCGVRVTDVQPALLRHPLSTEPTGPWPFAVDPRDAAERIVGGIHRSDPVVAFPWPLAAAARAGSMLPASLWDAVSGLGAGRTRR